MKDFYPYSHSFFSARPQLRDSRAQEVLKQAREAIGGEEQLQKIQGLKSTVNTVASLAIARWAAIVRSAFLLPNKYLVEDAMNAGGTRTAMINTRGLNGERAWSGQWRRWQHDHPHGWTRRPESDSGADRGGAAKDVQR